MRLNHVKKACWALLLTVAASAAALPHAADWFTTRAQAGQIATHTHVLAHTPQAELDWLLTGAHAWNAELAAGRGGYAAPDLPDYLSQLRLEGSDMMSAVTIPRLGRTVPIRHGTSDEVLDHSAGHQFGTSLPIGGPGTHSVITAHSGLVRARLFTDLDQLGVGDVFFLNTAGLQHWYQVDRVIVVEPGDYHEYIGIEADRDLVTLFTCTPTGVNTHRLMVRGSRIPAPAPGDHLSGEMMLDAGFPVWLAALAAAALASVTSGQLIFRPKRADQATTPGAARAHSPQHARATVGRDGQPKKGRHQA
ncbi:MAG: class C sortase [Promicromonosporaceae bacterium]|nr:class C sortase [Promicromonosporaceae bacterium]